MSGCEVMRVTNAQWRGLEFEWINETHSGGNVLAVHQYVDRDTHSVKPVTDEPERFNVRGYICGDRLRDRVREFRDAFKRRGPGRLYDPWQNEDFTVYVERWDISPNQNILGVEFTATFIEAGEEPYPYATLSPLAAFADAIETLENDSATAFSEVFSVTNSRAVGVGAAITDAQGAWGYFEDSYRIGYASGAVVDLSVPDLSFVPAGQHADQLTAFFDTVDEQVAADRALTEFYARNISIEFEAVDPNGAGAFVVGENRMAFEALIARMSFARLASILINSEYATREQALDAVNTLAGYANDLTRHDALNNLQVSQDVSCILSIASQVPLGLPVTREWTATKRQSALVLAHDIYCDIGRADELATLNNALVALPRNPIYAAV